MAHQSNPRKISKRGNSDHVSIDTETLEEAGLERGDRVVWRVEDGDVLLEKVEWRTA